AMHQAPLPAPLAFKLTLAREQRPQLFTHSIEVALVAVYLQGMNGQRIPDLALAAAAGLFHDVGILHISPEILAPGKALADAGRRYLYTHPITAHLIVREFPALNPVVSTAILEHHERMDGSGYPHGVKAERLSELGKILMMADSGAALLKSSQRGHHGVALRLLRRKFSPLLLAHLSRLFAPQDEPAGAESASDQDLALRQLAALAEILLAWDNSYAQLQAEHPESAGDLLLDLSNQRIVALERSLLEAGLVADQLEAFTSVSMQDEAGAQEMRELAREALWQLKDITFEVHRRWAEAAQPDAVHQAIAHWLERADERLTSV
ncbi:MAG: HD domain-containing protein, partial [Proteobacteria bacterium]|nr:HD domain-containing protein [Pseudomonadota bacterium]